MNSVSLSKKLVLRMGETGSSTILKALFPVPPGEEGSTSVLCWRDKLTSSSGGWRLFREISGQVSIVQYEP